MSRSVFCAIIEVENAVLRKGIEDVSRKKIETFEMLDDEEILDLPVIYHTKVTEFSRGDSRVLIGLDKLMDNELSLVNRMELYGGFFNGVKFELNSMLDYGQRVFEFFGVGIDQVVKMREYVGINVGT